MLGDLMTSVMYSLGLTHYIALKSVIGNLVIGSCFSGLMARDRSSVWNSPVTFH